MSRRSGPAFSAAERAAVYRAIAERRDVRDGFVDRSLPEEVLRRVLEAAHCAPSVGLMQPTRFIVVRNRTLREEIHEAFLAANAVAEASYAGARAQQYRELKLEAILDSTLNLCVLCDTESEQGHRLGRHSMPETAVYSSVCAVENLWLAARAESVGVGWVSILDVARMRAILHIPERLTVVAYLCLGYVDAFADVPELERAGWEHRRALQECLAWDKCGKW